MDVQSLGAAFVGAWTLENWAKTEPLYQAGYRLPVTVPGNTVTLEHLEAMVEFIVDNIELVAAEAVEAAELSARIGAAPNYSPAEVIAGLTGFVDAAKRWVAEAKKVGGPAVVVEGVEPDIVDPTTPAVTDFPVT